MMDVNITGDAEFDRRMASIERGASAIAGRATYAAAGVYRDAIAEAAPVGPTRKVKGRTVAGGALRRSVGRRRLTRGRDRAAGAKVGVNVTNKKGSARRAPHGHLATLGTVQRFTGSIRRRPSRRRRRTGIRIEQTGNPRLNRGVMPPNDFVPRAVRASEAEAHAELLRVVDEEITRRAEGR